MLTFIKHIYLVVLLSSVLITLRLQAQQAQSINAKVEMLLQKYDINSAILLLDNSIKNNPGNDTFYVMLGMIYLNNNLVNDAQKLFENAIQIDGNNKESLFSLAEIYTIKNELNKAKILFKNLLPGFSNKAIILQYLSQIAVSETDLSSAEKYIRQLVNIDSTNSYALRNLGILLLNKGGIEEAEALLIKSTLLSPSDAEGYLNLGILYAIKGEFHESIINLNNSFRIDSTNSKTALTIGEIYLSTGINSEAEIFFNKALRNNPFSVDALIGLYILKQKNNERESASKILERIEKYDPTYLQLNLLRADYNYSINKLNEAIYFIVQQTKLTPEFTMLYYVLSRLYNLSGDLAQSEVNFEKATQLGMLSNNFKMSLFDFLRITSESRSTIINQ